MKRTFMLLAVALSTTAFFARAEQREFVTGGEVLSISVEKGTLTLREISDPRADSRPGTMQSGVVRDFMVTADTKLMAQGQSINLGAIRAGDRVTIHYVLDSGRNVARSVTRTSSPSTN
jgi:hypothetical protein